ncbi:hypothetical protein DZ772_09350 [Enterococcus faecalis]|nr:hypothetical protein [Enterococcus faecalis]
MFFNFWRISAYFRRSCFCSRRLLVFERGAKIQSDFCSTLFSSLKTRPIAANICLEVFKD